MIQAGRLRFRCELLEKERSGRNDFGEKLETGTLISSFRADILSSKQTERRIAKGNEFPSAITFHCRYMPGINVTPEMVIRFNGDNYEILDVENPGNRNIELYIITEHRK